MVQEISNVPGTLLIGKHSVVGSSTEPLKVPSERQPQDSSAFSICHRCALFREKQLLQEFLKASLDN